MTTTTHRTATTKAGNYEIVHRDQIRNMGKGLGTGSWFITHTDGSDSDYSEAEGFPTMAAALQEAEDYEREQS